MGAIRVIGVIKVIRVIIIIGLLGLLVPASASATVAAGVWPRNLMLATSAGVNFKILSSGRSSFPLQVKAASYTIENQKALLLPDR